MRTALEAPGFRVFDAHSEGMPRRSDGEQPAHATRLDAVLITRIRYDFEILTGGWRALQINHPGIVSLQAPIDWPTLAVRARVSNDLVRTVGRERLRGLTHIRETAWQATGAAQKVIALQPAPR